MKTINIEGEFQEYMDGIHHTEYQGDATGEPETAQVDLDAALEEQTGDYEKLYETFQAANEARDLKTSLEAVNVALESFDRPHALILALEEADYEGVRNKLTEIDDNFRLPSLESYVEGIEVNRTVSLELIASVNSKVSRWSASVVSKMDIAISNFFNSTQRVANKALDVLAHSDRLLDGNPTSTVNQISVSGKQARSLNTGKRLLELHEASDVISKIADETINKTYPEAIAYANSVASAFGQSDLSKISNLMGIDKRGFMQRTLVFADIKPFHPSYCSLRGDKYYFFGLYHNAYQQTYSSVPLPGNRFMELTVPVGNLKEYVEREDVRGYWTNFPVWLSISMEVKKVDRKAENNSGMVKVPSPTELRSINAQIRTSLFDVRKMSVNSPEVRGAIEGMLDAYESHVYKRWDSVADILAKTLGTIVGIQDLYGAIAIGAGRSLYQTTIYVGHYLSTELHGLTSVSLAMAKSYKAKA